MSRSISIFINLDSFSRDNLNAFLNKALTDSSTESNFFFLCFPGGSDGKESACSVSDPSSIPGSGRSPGEGNGNPLQYSCLENSMDRGAWQATSPPDHKESDTTEQLSHTHTGSCEYCVTSK